MIYNRVLEESHRLESQIRFAQSEIRKLPEGKLIVTGNDQKNKWYQSDGHTSTYIPKQERQLAEQLAYKKYLSLRLEHMLQEKKAIDFYLRHHNPNSYQLEQNFITSPKYQELVKPFFVPLEQELYNWANSPFERSHKYSEHLVHKTDSGTLVRSKSEVLIDMVLYRNKIPFRYECLLELGDISIFPDFTIRHPVTGQVYYWEHFGMMDNPIYNKNVCSKLQLYMSNGIIPTIQLITTYETQESPLTIETVENIVKQYFL